MNITRPKPLTRGELAKRCEVNTETVRYYEQKGLLEKPDRSASNYRLYPPAAVTRLRFIKRARELGFTLAEIDDLLSLQSSDDAQCCDVKARAEAKIADIDEKIRSLKEIKREMKALMSQCAGEVPVSECVIVEVLESENGLKKKKKGR